jgi:hypothetical protein
MPAAVSAGAAAEIRSTATESLELLKMEPLEMESMALNRIGLDPITRASLVHRATVREAPTKADAAFHIPTNSTAIPHKPSTAGKAPMGSSTARGSSSRKEGTAKARVTPTPTTNGTMRKAKSRSAQRLAEYRWLETQTLRQTQETAAESTA